MSTTRRAHRAAVGMAIAAAWVMTACGGGGDDSRELTVTIASVADTGGSDWKVCLDSNASLSCDSGERVATATGDGRYVLKVPGSTTLTGSYWVAEQDTTVGDTTTTTSFRLAAPASNAVISSLTTLAVAQTLSNPTAGLTGALDTIRTTLGLASTVDLMGMPSSTTDADLYTIAQSAQTALQTATSASAARALVASDSSTGSDSSAAAVTKSIAQATLEVLGRYTDGGRLLATVSDHTITGEINGLLNPTDCHIDTPLRIYVDTTDAAPITSTETYVKGRLRTEASTLYGDAIDVATSIRGRGNTTWTMPKKPYKVKLDKAASLLGMHSDKEWALLANYADKTLLRNAVAMCLGTMTGMAYTPSYRFVELVLNGEYQGVYQLMETVKTEDYRVDIGSTGINGDDPGGFLIEYDARLDADDWFRTTLLSSPFTLKSDTTAEQVPLVKKFIDNFETALFSETFTSRTGGGYSTLLDTESLVDFYLINEYLRNNDVFYSSTFVTRKDTGKLVFGPLWDFDIAAGNINYNGNEATEGFWARTDNYYLPRLFEDPTFAKHVSARWRYLSARLPALQRFITTSAATLDEAQTRNFQTWDILNGWVWPNAVVTGSYAGEVNYLTTWLDQRAVWLDGQYGATSVSSTAGRKPGAIN